VFENSEELFCCGARYFKKQILEMVILCTRKTRKSVRFGKLTLRNLLLIMYPELCAVTRKIHIQIII